jgi:hypothetical protein
MHGMVVEDSGVNGVFQSSVQLPHRNDEGKSGILSVPFANLSIVDKMSK